MNRQERRHGSHKKKGMPWWIWAIAAVVIIGGIVFFVNNRGTGVDYTPFAYSDDVYARPNATHVVEEFSDFQCPYCQQLSPVMRAVREIDDVSVVYKEFPLRQIHGLAQEAAEAAECARDQNRFWAYHDVLFETKKIDSRSLKLHAQGLGLDMDKWNACMSGGQTKSRITSDVLEGNQRNVQGTPAIFIDGELSQARTLEDFKAALN